MCCSLLKLEVICQWLTVGCLSCGVSQRQKGTGSVLQLMLYLLVQSEILLSYLSVCVVIKICCDSSFEKS